MKFQLLLALGLASSCALAAALDCTATDLNNMVGGYDKCANETAYGSMRCGKPGGEVRPCNTDDTFDCQETVRATKLNGGCHKCIKEHTWPPGSYMTKCFPSWCVSPAAPLHPRSHTVIAQHGTLANGRAAGLRGTHAMLVLWLLHACVCFV